MTPKQEQRLATIAAAADRTIEHHSHGEAFTAAWELGVLHSDYESEET